MKYIAKPVTVQAKIIIAVGPINPDGSIVLNLQDGEFFQADKGVIARYIPTEGDYIVTQEDGYRYVNPKHVFERKYMPFTENAAA